MAQSRRKGSAGIGSDQAGGVSMNGVLIDSDEHPEQDPPIFRGNRAILRRISRHLAECPISVTKD
jgi:hypothetical protein